MGNIGLQELLVIFGVVLLFFGAKRIPEIARALGKATREFKNARDEVVDQVRTAADAKPEEKKADDAKNPAAVPTGKKDESDK